MMKIGKNIFQERMTLLLVAFFIAGAGLIARLFYLQIIQHKYYLAVASGQHDFGAAILQSRGEIFMCGGINREPAPLAINRKVNLLYAVPKEIINPVQTAEELARILEMDETKRKILEDRIFNQVSKPEDPYEPLYHRLSDETALAIRDLKLTGIYFRDEFDRFYPEQEATGHVIGFFGYGAEKPAGQYGVEGFFEQELAGKRGQLFGTKDGFGRIIPANEQQIEDAEDGADIILTLDKIIQNKAYELIKQAVGDYQAADGSMIVMEPATGNIKAMVNYPSFDPNNYNQVKSIQVFRNLAVSQPYEPGSVFKIITMAAGLDSGRIAVNDTFTDQGSVKFGVYVVKNAGNKTYGRVNMTEVLENSINTGAVHIALTTGREKFKHYLEDFGFGQSSGASIFGEAAGDISALSKRGEIYTATAAYGQGITVTPLQMVSALATIVNDGKLVKPRLADYILDNQGEKKIVDNYSENIQVISPRTAILIKAMMVSVVENGYTGKAAVPGYHIGGKTGTAQIAAKQGGYLSNETNHSFIGFGPLENSRFVIIVKLTKPKIGQYAESTAVPVFAKMADFLLQYYQVPPEKQQ